MKLVLSISIFNIFKSIFYIIFLYPVYLINYNSIIVNYNSKTKIDFFAIIGTWKTASAFIHILFLLLVFSHYLGIQHLWATNLATFPTSKSNTKFVLKF